MTIDVPLHGVIGALICKGLKAYCAVPVSVEVDCSLTFNTDGELHLQPH